MEKQERSSFSSRVGFVLAASGSAVGLGNLWRFPYLAARYGGGIFLLVYLILVVTFGFSLMITEFAIGRKTKLSCIGAYGALDKRFNFLGWIAAFVPLIITPYYCVIGGWVMKYLWTFISGGALDAADNGGFFSRFIGFDAGSLPATILNFSGPTPWFVLFVLITGLVVIFGVQKGIENASRLMMPVLAVLIVVIALYSLTIPGALAGVKYYLMPDFSQFSASTVLGACGQMFYSMSLAMGITITYGSYMPKENLLEHSVTQIEIFDTLFAFFAGLMIIPAVIAFNGGDPSQVNSGPSLMFISLPMVFDSMKFGTVIGAVFFLLVLFAALTSSIALMETLASVIMDKFKLKRIPATLIIIAICLVVGMLSCLGYGPWESVTIIGMQFLDFFDFLTNSVMMPIAAITICLLVSRVIRVKAVEEEVMHGEAAFRRKKIFNFMIKYLCPVFAAIILLSSVANAFGWIKM